MARLYPALPQARKYLHRQHRKVRYRDRYEWPDPPPPLLAGLADMLFGRTKRRITRLLVVEDEPLVAFDTEHLLTDAGFTVVATVDRVAEATALLAGDTAIDLVLVDVDLAGGTGLDVARAARAREVPVLFVTGNCPLEAQEIAAGCLAKPYAQRDLLGAIGAIDGVLAGRAPGRMPAGFRLFAQG